MVRFCIIYHVLTSMQNVDTTPRVHPALSLPPGSLISSKAMRSSMCRLPTRDQMRSSSRRTASLVGCGDQSVPPRRRYARPPSTPRSLRSTLVKNSTVPAFHGPHGHGDIAVACEEDDRQGHLGWAVYLPPADKYSRLIHRVSSEQKGLDERALLASQRPSPPW